MNEMNPEKFYSLDWDIQSDYLLSKQVLENVSKFHQSTTFTYKSKEKPQSMSKDLYAWVVSHEKKQTIPNVYYGRVKLNDSKMTKRDSGSNFNKNYIISFNFLSQLIQQSFGINKDSLNRYYPSAGALYPVNTLIYVFKKEKVERIDNNGVYFYDAYDNSILLLQIWNKKDLDKVKDALFQNEDFLSQIAIGYSIDIRKSLIKYRNRGYRHAFIEVGLMAQRFREVLVSLSNNNFGERCWSGFSDNSLTYLSGLNVKYSPVGLVQWFGKRDE